MEFSFEKYEGLGNDFIVWNAAHAGALSSEQAVALCDRHFGIGADGVLLVSPASSSSARARMTVLNADGSRPEMCGNGLRCVALYLAQQSEEPHAEFEVETDAGLRHCRVEREGRGASVTTGLGQGVDQGSLATQVQNTFFSFQRVSMGNPHAISFQEPISSEFLDLVGPAVSAQFSEGSNVEIATVLSPTEIRVDVWERGVGRTLACGTGAAATVVAAVQAGHSPVDEPVTVHLPGGALEITVSPDQSVSLRGPARWVYSGKAKI